MRFLKMVTNPERVRALPQLAAIVFRASKLFTQSNLRRGPNLKPSRLAAASFLFFAVPLVYSQTPPSHTSLTENPVYQKNCAKCHGKTAEGRHFGGPSLVSEKTTSASADDLRTIISNGKHHMPKYAGKLTPEEIDTLVQEIKASK